MARRKIARTKEEKLKAAKEKFGDLFDYSNWDVTDSRTPKWLTCNTHNFSWKISYDNLMRGKGCPLCKGDKIAKAKTQPFSKWYEKCKQHNPDCELLEDGFEGFCKPARFVCKYHGKFTKIPQTFCSNKHGGCPICTEEKGYISTRRLTREECLERVSHLKHIDFSESEFGCMSDYVTFYCTIHKKYHSMRLYNLRYKNGCDECGKELSKQKQIGWLNFTTIEKKSDRYKKEPSSLYLIKLPSLGRDVYKVGIAKSIANRFNTIQRDFGDLEEVYILPSNTYTTFYSEQFIQRLFRDNKYILEQTLNADGERKRGHSELFTFSEDDLERVMLLMDNCISKDWVGGKEHLEYLLTVNGGSMY